MYSFLLARIGPRAAFWLTTAWYVGLLILVAFTFNGPAAEFRYGHL
jgi:hypothetical protein